MKRNLTASLVAFNMLVFLFLGPLACTWFLAHSLQQVLQTHFHGTHQRFFINPITPITTLPITTHGQPFDTTQLRGKWILVYSSNAPCTHDDCTPYMTNMLKIRHVLKKNHQQLIPLWLTTSQLEKKIDPSNQLRVMQVANNKTLSPNHFYIVDPLGNLILSYQNNVPAESILSDLQNLMRVPVMGA